MKCQQPLEKMNQRSLVWGIGITVAWLVVIFLFWFFGDLKSPTSINELGDFLAGIFAPVAFLWLVLGYIQQGKQVEQNTKALEQQERALQLQIDEMRESVKQQREMNKVKQNQLISSINSVQPLLEIIKSDYKVIKNDRNAFYKVNLVLKNSGLGPARYITIVDAETNEYITALDDNDKFLEDIILNANNEIIVHFVIGGEKIIREDEIISLGFRLNFKDIYKNSYSRNIVGFIDSKDNTSIYFI